MASSTFSGLLTVDIHYSGVFTPKPLLYEAGLIKTIFDVDFAGMTYHELVEFIRKITNESFYALFYCVYGKPLINGLKCLKTDEHFQMLLTDGYTKGNRISIYLEQYDEPIEQWILDEWVCNDESDKEEFEHNRTLKDSFLYLLCNDEEDDVNMNEGTNEDVNLEEDDACSDCSLNVDVEQDDDPNVVGSEYNVKNDVVYPRHDPNTNWKTMKPVLGMKFENPYQLKQCLINYAVANGYPLYYIRNDHKTLLCKCGKGAKTRACPFRCWATWMAKEQSFQIKSLIPDHTCSRSMTLGSIVTYHWIAKQYVKKLVDNPRMSYRAIADDVFKKYKIKVTVGQCRRAKDKALKEIEGNLKDHYARIWDYGTEILRSNPGSTVNIEVNPMPDEVTYFSRMYVCFSALKNGWKEGCRRIIGLDGCFLKGMCTGEVLSAIGRDANNGMFPISWGVVCVENKDNWKWFIDLLISDLQLEDGTGLTIISDQHKGLVEAVKELLPNAEHRQCARHIYANFKKQFSGVHYRNLFWNAARCTVEEDFMVIMSEIKQLDMRAYTYLMERDPNSWCRAFFELGRACEALENGVSESFNSWIHDARLRPIITMLEEIRVKVMERLHKQANKAEIWDDHICPVIKKKMDKLKDKQRLWTVRVSGGNEFEVRKAYEGYHVDLDNRFCSCRFWQISGIPCVHAIAAIGYLNQEPEHYVSSWFTREMYLKAYHYPIRPMNGSTMWPRTPYTPPLPPIRRKMPGRPKTKRKRDDSEKPDKGKQRVSKLGNDMTCTNCGQKRHNKRGCKSKKAKVFPSQASTTTFGSQPHVAPGSQPHVALPTVSGKTPKLKLKFKLRRPD